MPFVVCGIFLPPVYFVPAFFQPEVLLQVLAVIKEVEIRHFFNNIKHRYNKKDNDNNYVNTMSRDQNKSQ